MFPIAEEADVEMPMPWRLQPATFVDRPNRFLTHIHMNGQLHVAHLPDPGRLAELLLPGVDLLVQHHSEAAAKRPTRKTAYTVHMVRRPDGVAWVCINTLLPNRFVEVALWDRGLPFLAEWTFVKREVSEGDSRFDFLLRKGGKSLFLEVKSVTYVDHGVAQFPDAISARGARHARHLARLARAGQPAMILFVIQREDARLFRPMWDRDPVLGNALVEAQESGVAIHAIKLAVTPEAFAYRGEVPVDLSRPGA